MWGGNVLRGEEPVESGVGILLHGGFDGMSAYAAAVTAIVEEQDVEAGVVKRECAGESVRD